MMSVATFPEVQHRVVCGTCWEPLPDFELYDFEHDCAKGVTRVLAVYPEHVVLTEGQYAT